MADLSETIENAAQAPRKAVVDGREGEAHPLQDVIAADKYLGEKSASSDPTKALRFKRIVPPGTV